MDEYSAYKLLVDGTHAVEKKERKIKKVKNVTKEEKIRNLRLKNKIKCSSNLVNIPDPINGFKDLIVRYNVSEDFLKCFASLEYKSPTPVQMQSIPIMLERHNVFTIAPTGSGKTAAFLIPIIQEILNKKSCDNIENNSSSVCFPTALILSPTAELAKQTFQECICLLKDIDSKFKPRVAFYSKNKQLNLKADIVICTPLKLENTLLKKEQQILNLNKLAWLVIDESDKMFDEGINSFSSQFKVIYEKCKESSGVRVAMFSATQTKPVIDWVKEHLSDDLIYVRVGVKDAAVNTVSQELRYCYSEMIKFAELQNLVVAGQIQVPCLIFLDQSQNAEILYDFIKDYGTRANINVSMISGKLNDSSRRNVISDFREGKIHFLICTNLLARGIDFKGVTTVVNYDLPVHKEEYIHRIGRCGRAGHLGKSISFWTDEDAVNGLPLVLSVMKASGQPVNEELLELVRRRRKMCHYKGDKILKGLKRKYQADDGTPKPMKLNDKKRKLYVENCVVRKKFLRDKMRSKATGENSD